MICPDCSALLPHDLAHVQEHAAICTGSTVELFLGRYMSLCESIERMAKAGGPANTSYITTITGPVRRPHHNAATCPQCAEG